MGDDKKTIDEIAAAQAASEAAAQGAKPDLLTAAQAKLDAEMQELAAAEQAHRDKAEKELSQARKKPTGFVRVKAAEGVIFMPHGAKPGARPKKLMQGLVLDTTMFHVRDVAHMIANGHLEYVDEPKRPVA
jgi:hypothetical protein